MELITLETGTSKFSLKESMALVSRTTNTTNAAFSKSVNCSYYIKEETPQTIHFLHVQVEWQIRILYIYS